MTWSHKSRARCRIGRHHRALQLLQVGTVQPLHQLLGAVAAHAHGGQHGHAQLTRQYLAVNGNALALGHVHHVEHQHHGQAQRALGMSVSRAVREAGGKVSGLEGSDTGEWVLVEMNQGFA